MSLRLIMSQNLLKSNNSFENWEEDWRFRASDFPTFNYKKMERLSDDAFWRRLSFSHTFSYRIPFEQRFCYLLEYL